MISNKVIPLSASGASIRLLKNVRRQQPGLGQTTFFCLWEAENENDVITSLTEYGMDDYIFTALYPIYMEIDTRRINDRKPFKDLDGWRDKLDPKDE